MSGNVHELAIMVLEAQIDGLQEAHIESPEGNWRLHQIARLQASINILKSSGKVVTILQEAAQ